LEDREPGCSEATVGPLDSAMTTREWIVAGFIALMLSLGAVVGLFVIV
jgi:hypothetical protein